MEGQGLAEPARPGPGCFPGRPARCSESARRRGRSTQQLETARRSTTVSSTSRSSASPSLFEPAVIIFMGVIVGFVAIALVSAMYGIYNQVKIQ